MSTFSRTSKPTPTETETLMPSPTPEATTQPMIDFSEATFVYDGNGSMVEALPGNACGEFELCSNSRLNCVSRSYVIDDVSTYCIGGHYELKVDGTTETETKYYTGPTGRFAMRVEGTLYWIFSDHLQSSSVILDEVGNVISRTDYTAFGEVRAESGTSPTDYQYTGQRSYMDSEPMQSIGFGENELCSFSRLKHDNVSYHYYVARWYDPYLNQFIQPDTIIPDPGNSADWNRYAYVNYNPINFNDPTGHYYNEDIIPGLTNDSSWWSYQNPNQQSSKPYIDRNIERQDYLYSLVFSGSGENGQWTANDWNDYYENRDDLWDGDATWKHPGPSGWEGFAYRVERLASHYGPSEMDQFVRDFALIFAGIPGDTSWWVAAWSVRSGPQEYGYIHEGNDFLFADYHDQDGVSDQAHHYAGIFFLSYFAGYPVAASVNWYRDQDTNNTGDILLGNVAAAHARQYWGNPSSLVGTKRLDPKDLPGLIRELMVKE